MTKKADMSMRGVAKGGAGFFLGRLSATFIKLVSGVIVIRFLAKAEYGLLSFGYVIANMFAMFALLGLGNGAPRYLAKYRDKDNFREAAGGLIGSIFFIQIVSSLFFTVLLYVGAEPLSELLSKPDATPVFKTFAFMVPPLVLVKGLTAVFRGIQRVKPKAIFEDTAVNALRLVLVLVAVAIGYEFQGVLIAYVAAVWIAFLLYCAYAYKAMAENYAIGVKSNYIRELLAFSLPLLGIGMIYRLMPWTATLFLGFFHPADEIAQYNAPLRLAALLLIAPKALEFIYSPIVVRKFENKSTEELKSIYVSTTKVVFIVTFPLIGFFLLDAEYLVGLIFGQRYLDSADVLRVITLGYCLQALTGPNISTLISSGDSRSALYSTLIAGVLVVIIGLWLIPLYGALGAAMSAAVALAASNLASSTYLYNRTRIHPIARNYAVPLLLNMIAVLALYYLVDFRAIDSHLYHFIIFVFLFVLSVISPFVTGSIDMEDIDLIKGVERKLLKRSSWSDRLEVRLKEKHG